MTETKRDRIMLLATGTEVVGHGAALVVAPWEMAGVAANKRLLRRIAAVSFLLALAGIGLAFPVV